jgi:hypothetical protein
VDIYEEGYVQLQEDVTWQQPHIFFIVTGFTVCCLHDWDLQRYGFWVLWEDFCVFILVILFYYLEDPQITKPVPYLAST